MCMSRWCVSFHPVCVSVCVSVSVAAFIFQTSMKCHFNEQAIALLIDAKRFNQTLNDGPEHEKIHLHPNN